MQACGCVLPAAIVRRTPFDLHQLHSSQLTALPSASLSSHSAPSARTFSTSSALHDASKGQPKKEDATCTTSEASASPLASSHSSFPSTSTREAPPASASAYLLAQAALEDAQDPKKALWTQIPEEEPWEGDEPQARAIRRILEDQYKPLRVKVRSSSSLFCFRTAKSSFKGLRQKYPCPRSSPFLPLRPSSLLSSRLDVKEHLGLQVHRSLLRLPPPNSSSPLPPNRPSPPPLPPRPREREEPRLWRRPLFDGAGHGSG